MTRREKRYDIYEYKFERITQKHFESLEVEENKSILYKWILKLYTKGVSQRRVHKLYGQCLILHNEGIIEKPLSKLTEDDISEIIIKLDDLKTKKGWKASTCYDYKRWLKQFYNYYKIYDGRLTDATLAYEANLMYKQVKDIKHVSQMKQKDRSNILDIHDLQLMLSNCETDRNKAIVALLYYTGWRIEAIATIKIKHIDFSRKCWFICVNDKTGEARLPIYEPIPLLKKYLESHPQKPNDWLFLGERGNKTKPMLHVRYYQILAAIKKRIQKQKPHWDKPCNPHHFRHSWATRNVNRYSQRDFKKLGKWSANSRAITHYDHLNDEDLYASFAEENGVEEVKNNLDKSWLCTECNKVNTSLQRICSCGTHRFYSQKDKDQQEVDTQKELRLKFLDTIMSSPEFELQFQQFRSQL